ncbi:MAG: EamA family transporter [Pseudaminobacter sp.]|nr:EamA family transporter [Pseudaminobacter sp.]
MSEATIANLTPWLWATLAVVLTAVSHITFKLYSSSARRGYLVATMAGFVFVPVFSYLALKTLTVAQMYLCVAFVPAITTTGARFLVGETINWRHAVGLLLICGGVLLYQTAH